MESQDTEADIRGNSKDVPHLRYPVFNSLCPPVLQLFPFLNLESLGEIFFFILPIVFFYYILFYEFSNGQEHGLSFVLCSAVKSCSLNAHLLFTSSVLRGKNVYLMI